MKMLFPDASRENFKPEVELWTDGACLDNPGVGGWACILVHIGSGKAKQWQGAEPETTNNRMELEAVIRGLSALTRRTRVALFADSDYVLNGVRGGVYRWKANGWTIKLNGKKEVKNADLWQRLHPLLCHHEVLPTWVRGHTGVERNEACDRLATEAAEQLKQQMGVSLRA